MGLPQCIIVTSLFSLFYVLVIVTGSYTKDEPLIWRCHSFLAVFSFRSLAASKRLLEKKYHKVCYNVNDSCMCWFIFVNVKTERNEKSKAEGYGVAYFPVHLLAYSVFVIIL